MSRTPDSGTASTPIASLSDGPSRPLPVAADGRSPRSSRPCRAVAHCVFEYLDGELGPALAAEVAAHLAGCAGCRCRVARDRALLDVIARAARADDRSAAAPPSLRARLHLALSRAERGWPSARRRA